MRNTLESKDSKTYHMQESVDLLLTLSRESSGLNTIHEHPLHSLRIRQLLHKTSVLLHTFDSECLCFGSNGIDKVIIWNRHFCYFTFDFGVVGKRYSFRYCLVWYNCELNVRIGEGGNLTSTDSASASMTETTRFLCRVRYLVAEYALSYN